MVENHKGQDKSRTTRGQGGTNSDFRKAETVFLECKLTNWHKQARSVLISVCSGEKQTEQTDFWYLYK